MSKYGVISGPYIQSKYKKIRTRNNSVSGHFPRSVGQLNDTPMPNSELCETSKIELFAKVINGLAVYYFRNRVSSYFDSALNKPLRQPFNDQCSHHIKTSQLIWSANQLTGFYMMGTLVVKRLILKNELRYHSLSTYAKFPEKPTFLNPWYAHARAYQV